MSDDIHSVGDNQKPPTEKGASNPEGGKDTPCVLFSADAPINTDKRDCEQNGSRHKLKEGFEFSLKCLEAVAFIAIIFTFLEMRRTRMDDERAWVAISDVTGVPSQTRPNTIDFMVFVKNTGKTPAINVHSSISRAFDTNSIPARETIPKTPEDSWLLAPDSIARISNIMEPASDWANRSFKDGSCYYVYGTVWYDDIFRHHHWTQYCFMIFSNVPAFFPAPFHNICDN